MKDELEEVFEALLDKICTASAGELPNTMRMQLPLILSRETTKLILSSGKSAKELSTLFADAMHRVNRGSTESMDTLLSMELLGVYGKKEK